jgi:hypothetical protein
MEETSMSEQMLENRFFYGMWLLALISVIAAMALRNTYGDIAILLPLVVGSSLGVVAAIVLKIKAHKEAAKDVASLTTFLNDQQTLETQQVYFTTAAFLARSFADDSFVDTQTHKLLGIREQPRTEFFAVVGARGRLVTAG